MKVKIDLKNRLVQVPSYQTAGSSGADVRAFLDEPVVIKPHSCTLVPTGLSVEIPEGCEIQIRSRSGLSLKHGIVVLNSPGTIDSDYRGEIKIILFNTSDKDFEICNGDRIAQMVMCEVKHMDFVCGDPLSATDRGEGGFGSTGGE